MNVIDIYVLFKNQYLFHYLIEFLNKKVTWKCHYGKNQFFPI